MLQVTEFQVWVGALGALALGLATGYIIGLLDARNVVQKAIHALHAASPKQPLDPWT